MQKTKKKKFEITEGFCPSCNRILNLGESFLCEIDKQYSCKCGWAGYWIGKRKRSTGKMIYYYSVEEYQKHSASQSLAQRTLRNSASTWKFSTSFFCKKKLVALCSPWGKEAESF